jgi:hypothetical protein
MIHFTCDLCGKPLLADEQTRYVVKIEVYAAYDPMEVSSEDAEGDHSEEMNALIEHMKGMSAQDAEEQVYKKFRFDLCPSCQARFLKDPLFRVARKQVRFGDN